MILCAEIQQYELNLVKVQKMIEANTEETESYKANQQSIQAQIEAERAAVESLKLALEEEKQKIKNKEEFDSIYTMINTYPTQDVLLRYLNHSTGQ